MASETIDQFRAPLVVTSTTISTSVTSAIQIHPGGATGRQNIILISDVDCYIKFGTASVGAATSADEFFPAGFYYPLTLANDTTFFTVLGTGSGILAHTVEGYAG